MESIEKWGVYSVFIYRFRNTTLCPSLIYEANPVLLLLLLCFVLFFYITWDSFLLGFYLGSDDANYWQEIGELEEKLGNYFLGYFSPVCDGIVVYIFYM